MIRQKINLALLALVFVASSCNRGSTLNINSHIVSVELAQTQTQQQKGLSSRSSLAFNSGMLFLFDQPGQPGFWMKDMNFSLDFIWMKDGKVVEITPDVSNTNLNIYKSKQAVDSMLEVNAGWAAKNNVKVGDSVVLTR